MKLDVQRLVDPETKEALVTNLADRLDSLQAEDPEAAWANFRNIVYDSAILILGHPKRKHQDWLTATTQRSPAYLNKNKSLRSKVQTVMRQMKWWVAKAAKSQQYADEHNSKKFFASLKTVGGVTTSAIQQTILHMAQCPVLTSFDDLPTLEETQKAIKQLFKLVGEAMAVKLTELMQQFCEAGSVPQNFNDANVIHLNKNKGSRASCDNHRGISLLSITGKIMALNILNRILHHLLDDVVSESQCGFKSNRRTIDLIFALRQLQGKCREQNQNLYVLFVDLMKAFDTVNREGLWSILSKFDCPSNFIKIIRSFHNGMMARVVENGSVSDPFSVYNKVKKGCALAPTLMFATVLVSALSNTDAGITIHYRYDNPFFDLRRLKARAKVLKALMKDFLFADDCALAALREPDLQELFSCLATVDQAFGLTTSLRKTEVMLQPAPGFSPPEPNIDIEGTTLNNMDSFTYLGSCLS
ncbi:probable RNA-directed DNA polymerase from transposon BS [Penaeus vannamei]|uniref:probable RNA-directed DNA polymerase from transposon BS n=1 Tax=Penaeus vannamei TaxID=6689 RepID=UPI00387FAF5F